MKGKIPASVMILCAAVIAAAGCISMSRVDYEGERLMKMKQSKQYRDGKFSNIEPTKVVPGRSIFKILKEHLFGSEVRIPPEPPPVVPVKGNFFRDSGKQGLRITWLGHSSVIIEIDGRLILADPVFGEKVSPFPIVAPRRFHRSFPLRAEDLPEIDLVILSHDHYDHLDHGTVMAIHKKVRRFVTALGVGAYLEKWGIPREKITELDWWESVSPIDGFTVTAAPSRHFSGRSLFSRNDTLWASWVIAGPVHRVFFCGDSGYHPQFREIGERFGPFDVTMLETAQYGKYWPHIHMTPEQCVRAHRDLRGKVLLPIHWGTFRLSLHSWNEPIERLLKEAGIHGVQVATPRAGEFLVYGRPLPRDRWWLQRQSGRESDSPSGKMAGLFEGK